jgi:indole-3-glycerol phosphate synthase
VFQRRRSEIVSQVAANAPDLLATIVAAARRMTEVRRDRVSEAQLEKQAAQRRPNGDGFVRALRDGDSPRVIAECKRRSPSRGILRADYRPAEHAAAYAEAGAAAISVLTEPTFFDGSLDHLALARQAVDTPLLRKDFIVERYQIAEAAANGADAILLIVGALTPAALSERLADARGYGLAVLVEVHEASELAVAVDAGAEVIGVNSRNLRTLSVEPALHEKLVPRMPRSAVAVAESGLRDHADVARLTAAGYRAFLVGERLITESDPGAALRAFRGRP